MIYPWQQTQWLHITKLLSTRRLPHAMLLLGSDGLGKIDFAHSLASTVLCQQPSEDKIACGSCKSCLLLAASTHPDLHILKPTPPPNSKSNNPVLSIKIDAVRALCDQLNQTSQYGVYRVAILEQADLLNISAANSLLKTLEEPGQNVLMLMVTSRPHRLPVTIRSRCQTLRFSTPDEQLSLDWLQKYHDQSNSAEHHTQMSKPDDKTLKQALKYAHGSPLTALKQLGERDYQQLLSAAMTAKITGKNSLEYATKLSKFSKVQTLEGMLAWASDLAKVLACGSTAAITNEVERKHLLALAKKVNSRRLFQFQDQLNFNLSHSTIAVNEQLLWENLLLSWDNL